MWVRTHDAFHSKSPANPQGDDRRTQFLLPRWNGVNRSTTFVSGAQENRHGARTLKLRRGLAEARQTFRRAKAGPESKIPVRIEAMPPRYACWTILIDNTPTAFRAREKEELLATLQQLRRTNNDVVMKWFARGRLWESREEERDSWQRRKTPVGVTPERHGAKASGSGSREPLRGAKTPSNSAGGGAPAQGKERRAPRDEEKDKRGRDWRPGGQHKEPRDRFKEKNRAERAWSEGDRGSAGPRTRPAGAAQGFRPAHKPRESRPWTNKPPGSAPRGDRPWNSRPPGPAPRGDRSWTNKPGGQARSGIRPRNDGPRQPNLKPERRASEAPPKPAIDPRPVPPPRPAQTMKKPEPPERG